MWEGKKKYNHCHSTAEPTNHQQTQQSKYFQCSNKGKTMPTRHPGRLSPSLETLIVIITIVSSMQQSINPSSSFPSNRLVMSCHLIRKNKILSGAAPMTARHKDKPAWRQRHNNMTTWRHDGEATDYKALVAGNVVSILRFMYWVPQKESEPPNDVPQSRPKLLSRSIVDLSI